MGCDRGVGTFRVVRATQHVGAEHRLVIHILHRCPSLLQTNYPSKEQSQTAPPKFVLQYQYPSGLAQTKDMTFPTRTYTSTGTLVVIYVLGG